jgi:SulP family sulfate permease
MPIQTQDDISLMPMQREVENYSWSTLQKDFLAGFAVALMTIPQAMAYSLIAGLPLQCGLFAAIYGTIIAAFFGSSRHLIVGPSNAIAILVQAGTAEILYGYYRDLTGADRDVVAVQILTQLTLFVGILQTLCSVFKLGRLTQFVSHSVIIAYITGVAIAIVVNQLFTFLGIPRMQGVHSLYEKGVYIISHLKEIHIPTALIGGGSLITLLFIKRINKNIPAAVLVLAASSILVYILGLSSYTDTEAIELNPSEAKFKVSLVGNSGELYGILPNIEFPFFNLAIMNKLIPIGFAIALLSILETSSVAKSIAASSGQRLSVNQEVFGVGLANLFGSFIGAMPCSGSALRSTLNFKSGAKTRFAAIFNALIAATLVMGFGLFINQIPLAALAAILLVTVPNIINMRQFWVCIKATHSDALVLLTTLASCILFSLDIAFYIGVIMSITLYLKKASVPHLVECAFDEEGHLERIDESHPPAQHQIRLINVQGELFFGAVDLFQRTLKSLAEDDEQTRVIILRLKNARDMDATACLALQQLYDYLKSSGRALIACSLTEQSWDVLCDSGLVEIMGKENLFILDEKNPYLSVQLALKRAKQLIADGNTTGERDPKERFKFVKSDLDKSEDSPPKPAESRP